MSAQENTECDDNNNRQVFVCQSPHDYHFDNRYPSRIAFHQPANIAASTVSKTAATIANCIGFMAHNNPRPSRLAQMPFATRAPYPINGPSQNHPLHAKARTAKIIQAKYCRETP